MVSTTCGSGTVNVTGAAAPPPTAIVSVSSPHGCIGPQDVLVVELDAKMQPLASFEVLNQTFTNAGNADYHLQTYTPAVSRTYTWNDDNDATTVAMVDTRQSPHGTVYQSLSASAGGTTPTVSREAPAFGMLQDVVQSTVVIGNTQHRLYEWGQGAAYTTDWGAHRLPDITTATYDVASRQTTTSTTIYDWNIAATDTTQLSLTMLDFLGQPTDALQTLFGPAQLGGLETGTSGVLSVASYNQP
jgi:hypothetical protein